MGDFENIPSTSELLNRQTYKGEDRVMPIWEINEELMLQDRGKVFPTGCFTIDQALGGGFKIGDMVIVSGISGHGKTTYAQTITHNLAKSGIKSLWFSYEVSIENLTTKFLTMGLDEKDFVVYSPRQLKTGNIEWIRDRMLEARAKYGIDIVFIDHIDFLEPKLSSDKTSGDNQAAIYKRMATELKHIAVQEKFTIVLMAHVKKLQGDGEPTMQDVAYSAGVFQLADCVIMVHKIPEEIKKSMINFNDVKQLGGDVKYLGTKVTILKNRHYGTQRFQIFDYAQGRLMEKTVFYENTN